jgi:hypothetical protein
VKPLAILIAALLAVTNAIAKDKRETHLTAAQAIRLATVKARAAGVDFTTLKPPRAEYIVRDRWWVISWDEKPDKNGNVTIGGDYGS